MMWKNLAITMLAVNVYTMTAVYYKYGRIEDFNTYLIRENLELQKELDSLLLKPSLKEFEQAPDIASDQMISLLLSDRKVNL